MKGQKLLAFVWEKDNLFSIPPALALINFACWKPATWRALSRNTPTLQTNMAPTINQIRSLKNTSTYETTKSPATPW